MSGVADILLLGYHHHQTGDLMRAEQCAREVLSLEPDNIGGLTLLAAVCLPLGRFEEATVCLRHAVQLSPANPESHMNLGKALIAAGKYEEAEAACRGAAALNPDWGQAHFHLGSVLQQQRRGEEAAACYLRALQLDPADHQALNNLGTLFNEQKQHPEAAACFQEAVRLRPDCGLAHTNLASAYWELGRLAEAVACCHRALEIDPHSVESLATRGSALLEQGLVPEALASLEQALQHNPHFAPALLNMGAAVLGLGKTEEAREYFRQAVLHSPDFAAAHMSLGMVHLLLGNFAEGWTEYEWRWKTGEYTDRGFSQPRWNGKRLDGQTILLHIEQGLGDTLQCVRYAPLIKQRGGTVVVECQPALTALLERTPGIDRIVAAGDSLPSFDVHAAFMSLPFIFGTTVSLIPAEVPYVFADPLLEERWRAELGSQPTFKVGINWQGNPRHRKDRARSFPLEMLLPLARLPGVQLFSLQRDAGVEQLAGADAGIINITDRLEAAPGPIPQRAALMKTLDLVVTCDTVTAHLAGALGVPVWVALPFVPDFRWLLARSDSPWYPTMRLFRQPRPGDWESVFQAMAEALRASLS